MANLFFKASAAEIAQVDTFTPSIPDTNDVFSIQATDDEGADSTISFTVGATQTVKAVVEGMMAAAVAAKAAGTKPWDEITATEDDAILTLTVDTAGKPIYYTATPGDGETFAEASVTANSGPNDWNTQADWDGSDADLPGADASDAVYIDGGQDENSILYGLDQSGIANALTLLDVTRMQVGQAGAVGDAPYYLAIKSALIDINKTPGVGSPTLRAPVNINAVATATVFTVWNAGTVATDATEPGVNILAASASSVAYIKNGNVGIASHNGETATFGTVNVEGGKAVLGAGVTLTTLNQKGGECILRCACGTVDMAKGTLTTEKSGAISTKITVRGGSFISNSSGTIVELDALGGVCDFTQCNTPRTITLLKVAAGAVVKYDPAIVTVTTLAVYDAAGLVSVTVSKL